MEEKTEGEKREYADRAGPPLESIWGIPWLFLLALCLSSALVVLMGLFLKWCLHQARDSARRARRHKRAKKIYRRELEGKVSAPPNLLPNPEIVTEGPSLDNSSIIEDDPVFAPSDYALVELSRSSQI